MKKIFVVFLAAVICLISVAAYADGVDLSAFTDEELRELRAQIDVELSARQAAKILDGGTLLEGDIDDYHVALLRIETSKDYKGDPALILTILYTNNGKDTESYMTAVSTKLFQNGVQLERAISVSGVDTMVQMAEVRPGASVELQIAYQITDINLPVEIEFSRYIDFSKNPLKIIGTFSIEK